MNESVSIILSLASNTVTFLLTRHYHRKERKNDFEAKLLCEIADLRDKYLELNKNYIILREKQLTLEFENIRLRRKIDHLKTCNLPPVDNSNNK